MMVLGSFYFSAIGSIIQNPMDTGRPAGSNRSDEPIRRFATRSNFSDQAGNNRAGIPFCLVGGKKEENTAFKI